MMLTTSLCLVGVLCGLLQGTVVSSLDPPPSPRIDLYVGFLEAGVYKKQVVLSRVRARIHSHAPTCTLYLERETVPVLYLSNL